MNKINSFIASTLGLDIRKIVSITNRRPQQQVWISFLEEGDVIELENKIIRVVVFPESGARVNGTRLDSPHYSSKAYRSTILGAGG